MAFPYRLFVRFRRSLARGVQAPHGTEASRSPIERAGDPLLPRRITFLLVSAGTQAEMPRGAEAFDRGHVRIVELGRAGRPCAGLGDMAESRVTNDLFQHPDAVDDLA